MHTWRLFVLSVAVPLAAVIVSAPVARSQSVSKSEVTVAATVIRQQFDTSAMVMPDFTAYDLLYDGLLNLRPEGKVAGLAKSWVVSPDGKQIDFTLREGVKFHNGDAFSAEDVKFTFERVMAPESKHTYKRAFQSLERVDALGPYHVRFVLKTPWPAFFTSARYIVSIMPRDYFQKVGPKGFQERPVGTGPFKLAGMKGGEWTRYEANEEYWGGAPQVKAVTQRLVKEPFTRYAMLQRGEADIVMGLPGPLLKQVRADPKFSLLSTRYIGTSMMFFNRAKFPASADRRVRLAIAHAINREEIAKSILGGLCEPATGPFTPATFGYLEGLSKIAYDPDKAKALLREAGIKPGQQLSYAVQADSFSSLPSAPQVLEAIAGSLEAVGLKLERESYDSAAWLSMMRGGKQPAIFYGPQSAPDDGGEVLNVYYTSTAALAQANATTPEYEEIFRRQLQESNRDERVKLLQRFATLENERLESVPLFWCHSPIAVNSRIKALRPGLGSDYHLNFRELEFK